MKDFGSAFEDVVQKITTSIQTKMYTCSRPFLVGIDGASGAGKSTLAQRTAEQLHAVIVPSDDFYAAPIANAQWEHWTPAERYVSVIDWRRLRIEALEPLLNGKPTRWHNFDFLQQRADGTYPLSADWTECRAANCIILEGAYATRPELADLLHFTVLVDVPVEIRHARLAEREDETFLAGWHLRWDAVEAYYFSQVRPPSSFDLVVRP